MPRDLPVALEAERAVLGAILLRPDVLDQLGALRRRHFYNERHAAIYDAAQTLHASGAPVDVVALERRVREAGDWDRVGTLSAIADLATCASTSEAAEHHASTIRQAAQRREIIDVALRAADAAADMERTPAEVVAETTAALADADDAVDESTPIADVLQQVWEEIQARLAGKEPPGGIPTGLRDLDEILTYGGLPRSQVTTLAGATSAGKSALANTCALAAAQRGHGVLCCCFEDEAASVTKRLLARLAAIGNRQMQRAIVGPTGELDRVKAALATLARARVRFIERIPPDVADLCAAIRRNVLRHKIDLVVIDFLQLVRTTRKWRTRQEGVDHVFGEIVAAARRLPCATLVVSQLRRTGDRRPSKEDLYHSGALEQWSHTVALLWRPPSLADRFSHVALLIDKQKNGPTGRLALGWIPEWVSYADATPADAAAYLAATDKIRAQESDR